MKKVVSLAVTAIVLALTPVGVNAALHKNVAPDATVDAPYCSYWEAPSALSDGVVPSSSADEDVTRYGSWGSAASNVESLTYFWKGEVTVDSVGVYFAVDGTRAEWLAEGGLHTPAAYKVQYRDGDEYVDVSGAAGLDVKTDVMNVTTFDSVTTDSIRFVFYKVTDAEYNGDALASAVYETQKYYDETYPDEGYVATVDDELAFRGIGIYEIEVYGLPCGEDEPSASVGVAMSATAVAGVIALLG